MKFRTALGVFAAVALWGASFVATKIALRQLTPLNVVVLRFALGIGVVAAVLAWRRELVWPRRRDIPWLVLLGACGITFHQLLQANGLTTTTATNSGWIVALIPVFTAIIARFAGTERFGLRKVLGLAVASGGALVIVARGDFSSIVPRQVAPGDILMIVSAVNWAIFTVASKRMIHRYRPAAFIGYLMVLGWLLFLPFLAYEGRWSDIAAMSSASWGSIAFLGIGCSGLAYVFWYDALAEIDASAVASFVYLEPIVTVIVAAAAIGERVTWPVIAGGSMILAGVRLVNERADDARLGDAR